VPSDGARDGRIRILRVIARMNIGGPAYHVAVLGAGLDRGRYETLLVHGRLGRGEGSFEDLLGNEEIVVVPSLTPEVRPLADLRALVALAGLIRRFKPDIVDTHTAKAGTLGRLAALLAGRRRPILVHTYHGHVLEGYFPRPIAFVYRTIERFLGRFTDRLIGVSQATVDDLVRLGVAPRERFSVVSIGLDLDAFLSVPAEPGGELREELGVGPDDVLLAYVGRLVPIKRIDVLLRAVSRLRRDGFDLRLAIVGDGESRAELAALASSLGVADVVTFVGYRRDVADVLAGSDLAVLTSDNEGTPVSLIESAAAGRAAIATAVGGVPEVVADGCGILVPAGDAGAFADAVRALITDRASRREMGERARAHVRGRYSRERVVEKVDALYRELLASR
jgi:glycosyltransferase involved in cell wall biosynthesis